MNETPKAASTICDSRLTWGAGAAVIALVTFIVYLPVLRAGFLWDDDMMLTSNPAMRSLSGLYNIWFTTRSYDYFPMTFTSLWLEWRLWGMNPMGYHVVNVLLHGLGAILLWRVLWCLRIPGAWWAAMIFAVHPVCVASVAWIAERKNTLSLVFFLLSLLWFLRFDSESRDRQPATRKWYWVSLFAFLLALLSKTSVVTLPFVLLLCIWWRRTPSGRAASGEGQAPGGLAAGAAAGSSPRLLTLDPRLLLRLSPFFALSLALGLVTIWFQSHRAIGGDNFAREALWPRLLGGSWAVWFYLWKALLPVKLSMIYPRWEIHPGSVVAYLPAVLWLGTVGLCWRFRTAWGAAILIGLGYFFVMLLPVLGFFDMYFFVYTRVADHLQYLALIGVIALVAGTASSKFGAQSSKFLAVPLVILLGLLTWNRAQVFTNQETLWRDTLSKNPRAWAAYNNLGNLVTKPEERLHYYLAALRLKPDYAVAHNNFGVFLASQGKIEEAIAQYNHALRLQPGFADAHFNLGNVFLFQGKFGDAAACYRAALGLKPYDAETHDNLGKALLQQGQLAEAVAHFTESLRLNPDNPGAHNNLGNLASELGRFGDAATHYQAVLRAMPGSVEAHHNLGMALAALGRMAEATAEFGVVLKMKPDFAPTQYQVALLLLKQSRKPEAAQWFDAVVRNQPDFADAHYQLGLLLAEDQKVGAAIPPLREAVRLKPDWVDALNRLAWILATHSDAQFRNGAEAVRLAGHAAELTKNMNTETLDTLAAAYAEAGRFAEAVQAAQQARELAETGGEKELAARVEGRRQQYQRNQPWREPRGAAGQEAAP